MNKAGMPALFSFQTIFGLLLQAWVWTDILKISEQVTGANSNQNELIGIFIYSNRG